jgi:hypothetical protein
MENAMSGAILFGFWAIGLFFFRYWRKFRDPFFCFFAMAFWLFAIERGLLLLTASDSEARPYVYLVRLAGFGCIICAIIQKNRKAPPEQN